MTGPDPSVEDMLNEVVLLDGATTPQSEALGEAVARHLEERRGLDNAVQPISPQAMTPRTRAIIEQLEQRKEQG